MEALSGWELAYSVVVLLVTFTLRGSLGFGGAIGMPLFALVLPVKLIAPAWSLIGILSSLAILGRDRKHIDRKAFVSFLPGCALGVVAGVFLFKLFDARIGKSIRLWPRGAARFAHSPAPRSWFEGAQWSLCRVASPYW